MTFALLAKPSRTAPVPSTRAHARKPLRESRAVDAQFGPRRLASLWNAEPLETRPIIQTKLEVSEPNDKFEQEADSVAEKVMRSVEPNSGTSDVAEDNPKKCAGCSSGSGICSKCSGEERTIQRKPFTSKMASGSTAYAGADPAGEVSKIKGGGQPLPQSVRAVFEPRFGYDFGQVRIHTQPNISNLSRALGARAFTVGSDIGFGSGQFSPGTTNGKKLIAHELAHVVQQGSGTSNASQAQRSGQSPATIQRFSDADCKTKGCKGKCGDLGGDFKRAKAYIDVAIEAMKQKDLSAQTRTAMQWLFYLEDDSQNTYILKVLEVMREALDRADSTTDIKCEPNCDSAFTETPKNITPGILQQCTADIPCTIHLCDPYFWFGSPERATTLLHESGHLAGLPGDVYINDASFRFLSQKSALRNAEHFAMLVRALNGTLKSDVRVSIGAAGGLARSGGTTGWFATGMFDLTLNRPVYRIFNPTLRLSITGYGVEGSGRDERFADPENNTLVASVLGGVRLGRSRGPGGWFGDLLAGGGAALRGDESSIVFTASASLGYRFQRTEVALGASYIRDTTATKGFENVFLVGLSANFNFFDLIGK
jgi:hypothetical protein